MISHNMLWPQFANMIALQHQQRKYHQQQQQLLNVCQDGLSLKVIAICPKHHGYLGREPRMTVRSMEVIWPPSILQQRMILLMQILVAPLPFGQEEMVQDILISGHGLMGHLGTTIIGIQKLQQVATSVYCQTLMDGKTITVVRHYHMFVRYSFLCSKHRLYCIVQNKWQYIPIGT